jgi:hypothetical protein
VVLRDNRSGIANDVDLYAQEIGAGGQLGVRALSRNCDLDACARGYFDVGDAPEGVSAYPSGTQGRFPTCRGDSPAGTQEVECGSPRSTPPGPTGFVAHAASYTAPAAFGLGCGPQSSPGLAVDTEVDGISYVTGSWPQSASSACSPKEPVKAAEQAFGGLWFGADEFIGDADAGLAQPPFLLPCSARSFQYKAWSCGPVTVYLNVLVDWNQDGDWNDVVACPSGSPAPGGCAPEWAVKNQPVVLAAGCNTLATPDFVTGPDVGGAWMRVTLTPAAVSDDFPWRGSTLASGPATPYFSAGETEDYPVTILDPVAVAGSGLPSDLALGSPLPNPARGRTTLQYSLPGAAPVRIAIFNLAGKRVRTLVSGPQAAGQHTVAWDGLDDLGVRAPGGMYYVRLDAAGRSLSRSVVRLP